MKGRSDVRSSMESAMAPASPLASMLDPPSQFSWFFNGSQVVTGSVYETGPLTLASHGDYTCVAFNNITGRNSTVSKMLTIIGESDYRLFALLC
uniref:carcinoembryonic antigen-related cell adhesion molecule 6-like isoform X3 n=1 Tax=Oncorhynchus gorbuscha TaxID=8017 RepID=UPI001EAF322D|nr:carcinoembryonic antigen-related cell adhesion molecule 6-like isoform X3 [Oncorhynchus gorbuscha]